MRRLCLVVVLSGLSLLAGDLAPLARSQSSPKPSSPGKASAEEIRALIQQLGAEDYFVRQEAQERLRGLGVAALDQLVEAAEQADLEVAARARFLLRKIRIQWHDPQDPEPIASWMNSYAEASVSRRMEIIRHLAFHYEGQGLAPLCRIVRFEADRGLASLAGVLALRYPCPGPKYRRLLAQTVEKNLNGCQRVAALWLQQAVRDRESGKPDGRFWAQALRQQAHRFQASHSLLEMEILQQLLEYCWSVPQLARQGEVAQAAEAAVQVMARHGHESAGKSLALWLLRNRQWQGWVQLWPRLSDSVRQEPLMLYAAAAVHQHRGETRQAQQLLLQVRQYPMNLSQRVQLAERLRREKLYDWAIAEYGRALGSGPDGRIGIVGLYYGVLLADLQRYEKAAQVVQKTIQLLQAQLPGARGDAIINDLRAKQWFWEALAQQQKKGRPDTQLLVKAIQLDLQELDAIIALYRAADQPQEKRQAVQFIRQSLSQLEQALPRRIVRPLPNLATPFNQWAWLVSNTEGDYHKALKYSQQSLHLKPAEASYLDTLGRCYYALGRYEDAVVAQRLAVRLEPHFQQMHRQLQLFEQALARSRSDTSPKKAAPQTK